MLNELLARAGGLGCTCQSKLFAAQWIFRGNSLIAISGRDLDVYVFQLPLRTKPHGRADKGLDTREGIGQGEGLHPIALLARLNVGVVAFQDGGFHNEKLTT